MDAQRDTIAEQFGVSPFWVDFWGTILTFVAYFGVLALAMCFVHVLFGALFLGNKTNCEG